MTAPCQHECDACQDQGVLGRAPDGEMLYCEECLKGAELAMDAIEARYQQMYEASKADLSPGFRAVLEAALEQMRQERAEWDQFYLTAVAEMQEYELEHPFFEDTP